MNQLLWPTRRKSPDATQFSFGRIPTDTVPDWYRSPNAPRGYLPAVDIIPVGVVVEQHATAADPLD